MLVQVFLNFLLLTRKYASTNCHFSIQSQVLESLCLEYLLTRTAPLPSRRQGLQRLSTRVPTQSFVNRTPVRERWKYHNFPRMKEMLYESADDRAIIGRLTKTKGGNCSESKDSRTAYFKIVT